MALVVDLKGVENLTGSNDSQERLIRVSFRGLTQDSKVEKSCNRSSYFGQSFEWPLARPADPEECVTVHLYNYNKYLSNKLVAKYTLLMQYLVERGDLTITEPFTDTKNMIIKTTLTLHARYFSPDGRVGNWDTEQFDYPLIHLDPTNMVPDSESKCFTSSQQETASLLTTDSIDGLDNISLSPSTLSQPEAIHNHYILPANMQGFANSQKQRYMQVAIKVIEIQQLTGLDVDPVVRIQVGDQHKYSTIKQSTNSPFYDEYFVFEFQESAAKLFTKIITLTVSHALSIPGRKVLQATNLVVGRDIGVFKCDIGTVYSAPGHQFYHKWAVLLDKKDISKGIMGYLRCNISAICKGDQVKPPKGFKEEDSADIEGNLLLPAGMSMERQRATYSVVLYRAEHLPRVDLGVLASVKQVIGLNPGALIDAFIKISFLGQMAKSSVKKSYNPDWSEMISFEDMFPPLCNSMKIQLCDEDTLSDDNIATHFIELSQIMDSGGDAEGILPSYGPNWIYFYGGASGGISLRQKADDTESAGEGCTYCGRLLLGIKTSIMAEEMTSAPSSVYRTALKTANKIGLAPKKEFALFITIFEATMIDRCHFGKAIQFELTWGHVDSKTKDQKADKGDNSGGDDGDSDSDDDSDAGSEASLLRDIVSSRSKRRCKTPSKMPTPIGKSTYCHIDISNEKPCLYIKLTLEDLSKRSYHSNMLESISEDLINELEEVGFLIKQDYLKKATKNLVQALTSLIEGCTLYLRLVDGLRTGCGAGKTKLDKYRLKMCKNGMHKIRNLSADLKESDLINNEVKMVFKQCREMSLKIKSFVREPQQSMADIILWMLIAGKRVAFHKLSARSIMHATQRAFVGSNCSRMQEIFLKKPSSNSSKSSDWSIQAKLKLNFWLGKNDPFRPHEAMLSGLPSGFDIAHDYDQDSKPLPPHTVVYNDIHQFRLRAYMFQARGIIGSDDSGLSDGFVRIHLAGEVRTTKTCEATLSPTWDETLCFDNVVLHGDIEKICNDPPSIVVELFDEDLTGDPEFLGRVVLKPRVCLAQDRYCSPDWPAELQWCKMRRGGDDAGEILAAFELVEGHKEDVIDGPVLQNSKEVVRIPASIRPVLKKFRIEVLFWGLREPKRVQLLTVDRPRIDVQCGDVILKSPRIEDYLHCPNFPVNVLYMDLDLPENTLLWPPITIRCVDCRKFGREVLLGTTTVTHMVKYLISDKANSIAASRISKFSKILSQQNGDLGTDKISLMEKPPIVPAEAPSPEKPLPETTEKSRVELIADLDWWSKYIVSKQDIVKKTLNGSDDEDSDGSDMFSNQDDDMAIVTIDYGAMDADKLQQLQKDADTKHFVGLSKKKRKQLLKKKSKFLLKKAKGLVNMGFIKDDEDMRSILSVDDEDDHSHISRIKIYPNELEKDFDGFNWIETFRLFRGKQLDEEDDSIRLTGKFKGTMSIYELKDEIVDLNDNGTPVISQSSKPQLRLMKQVPTNNKPFKVQVNIYIVQAINLHPVDFNGKADPYVVISCGRSKINDKANRFNNQLNPVFGKLYQFDVIFPLDSMLKICIMDYDALSSDDLIGETYIDLEDRMFSQHRAICGLHQNYELFGYNSWRDVQKPTEILAGLCRKNDIPHPTYDTNSCTVAGFRFTGPNFVETETGSMSASTEPLALEALKHWKDIADVQLVPEHVESRVLHNSERPGIEQGRLVLWVDMFTGDTVAPTVDIKPRLPKGYELRIIIWNTDEVILEDENLITGEASSDIFVRGFLKGMGEDDLNTDIHYRSLTGEGNFNWRFKFNFQYLKAEEKIVFDKSEGIFDLGATEMKVPAKLTLQVWDADIVSADDFLGSVILDLNRLPRPSKDSKHCGLHQLDINLPPGQKKTQTINLFKCTRSRGWWPMIAKDNDDTQLVGKVEAEFQLITEEEADRCPVGLAREDPQALAEPNRPDTSFLWFMNPLKTLKYVIWKNFKWKLLKILLLLIVIAFLVLFFYSAPGAMVNKIFGR